jgi:hypothetical protein
MLYWRRLSLMPQLETVGILFNSHSPSGDIERQSLRTPITMRLTLPSLRWFAFLGASAYLEALLPRVTIPLLERLQVNFFNQLTYSTPNLQQFMGTAGNLRLNTATLTFTMDYIVVMVYPHKGARMSHIGVAIRRQTSRLAGSMFSTSLSHAQDKIFYAGASYASTFQTLHIMRVEQ